jgi:tagaturonate epimerase
VDEILQHIGEKYSQFFIYPNSLHQVEDCQLFMAKVDGEKRLFVVEEKVPSAYDNFDGEEYVVNGRKVKVSPLIHANAVLVRRLLPFTAPVAFGKIGMSMGLGDRLGLASPGHLELIQNTAVRPVLAQQSIRELTLTNRTYHDVLDAASWAVLQQGYREGFGADGDHLKSEAEVRMALDIGFSMITLDCSEKIDNSVMEKNDTAVNYAYTALDKEYTSMMEKLYLGKQFALKNTTVVFAPDTLRQIILIYGKAIDYIAYIYETILKPQARAIDFEVSIDETVTPTTPQAHFFVAAELSRQGVDVVSLAPRFCGEFQKGIDYIGDTARFEEEFACHAQIADHFGYRLSIHSGSDKFKVFPVIGKYTGGRVHVKTAGTNWLEALRVISRVNPALYRELHAYALQNFGEATKYYHVSAKLDNIPSVTTLSDEQLPDLLEHNDARQLLHITYGLLLTAQNASGQLLFKTRIYDTLAKHDADYARALTEHIGKHIQALYSEISGKS